MSHAPQAVLFDAVDLEHASLAQQLLRHPALSRHVPSRTVPTASWICGGPQIAEAAEALARLHPHQKRNPQKGDGGIKK